MGKEYVCDCGTLVRAKSAKQTIRCPKCGNMLNYGEIPEESAGPDAESFAVAEPTEPWRDTPESSAPTIRDAGYSLASDEQRASKSKPPGGRDSSLASDEQAASKTKSQDDRGFSLASDEQRASKSKPPGGRDSSLASEEQAASKTKSQDDRGFSLASDEQRASKSKPPGGRDSSLASDEQAASKTKSQDNRGFSLAPDEQRASKSKSPGGRDSSLASDEQATSKTKSQDDRGLASPSETAPPKGSKPGSAFGSDSANGSEPDAGYGLEAGSGTGSNAGSGSDLRPGSAGKKAESKDDSGESDFILRRPPTQGNGVFEPESPRYARKSRKSKTIVDPEDEYGDLPPPKSRNSQPNKSNDDYDSRPLIGPSSYGFDVNSEPAAPRSNESVFKPEVPNEPLVTAASVFEADPTHDPFLEETDEQRKARRKRPLPPNPDDSLHAGWRAWINPEGLLWLPILVPCFSIATGVIAAGVGSKIGTATGMQVSPFMTVFGVMLSLPFGCFMILHFADIIGAWALGTKSDPDWPDIVATGMVMQTFLLFFAILSGVLMSMLIAAPLYYALGEESQTAWILGGIIVAVGTFFYAPIAWLACVLWEDWRAANPVLVLGAIFRLNGRLLKFYGEVFVHLLVIVVLAYAAVPAFAASVILGGAVWISFWTVTLLSGARLARALGIVYAEHYRQLGWFT